VKKTQEKYPERNGSAGTNSGEETIQSRVERPSKTTGGPKQSRSSAVIYEEGDLRGIVAEALAKSIDPYRALSEAGVIKDSAEFFDGVVR
jgi:hypothetical protein